MPLCRSCQNITFNPTKEDSLDEFEAVIHADLASLERSAKSRKCNLCVALYGMIQRESLENTPRDQGYPFARQEVALIINYREEDSDEWVYVDHEVGRNDNDLGENLKFHHALFTHCLRVCNPEAIWRSSWTLEKEAITSSADQLEATDAASDVGFSDTSTGSHAAMALMRSWIKRCEHDHQVCGKRSFDTVSSYPTRLLDVSRAEGESGTLLLVLSSKLIQQHKRPNYATFSHRWNSGHVCITTASTERKYAQEGLPTKLLSRTFREACITVKNLGLRYLWIDSLCIIQQGDDASKAQEILRMADYYQNAYLNISAATERSEGLWQQRDGEAIRPFMLPIVICTPHLPRKRQQSIVRVAPRLKGPKSHLDDRGWILQERLFARRTIFFDPYWVSFQCAEMSASESCPEGIQHDSHTNSLRLEYDMGTEVSRDVALCIMGGKLRDLSSEVASGRDLGDTARTAVLGLWFDVLKEYSHRQLSFESDRLNAVSSLAERLSRILQDEYVGGIWKSHIPMCLQWSHRLGKEYGPSTREGACGAPTWSWASIGSGVVVEPSLVGNTVPLVRNYDLQWTVRGSNMFSDLSDCKLILSGSILRGFAYFKRGGPDVWKDMITVTEDLEELPQAEMTRHPEYGSEAWKRYSATLDYEAWWLHICGKKSGEQARRILRVFPDTHDSLVEGFFHVLPLVTESGRLFGLILKELDDGRFQRVGCTQISAQTLMKGKKRQIVLV